ncbi:unnamed protein product, partial [marine sediment metagenome]
MSESVAEQMQRLRDEWREILRQELIAEGWTPPPEKPEPEFKAGDYVEVRDSDDWELDRFLRESTDELRYVTEGGGASFWKQCRHAPTWIKWEKGSEPGYGAPASIVGDVFRFDG